MLKQRNDQKCERDHNTFKCSFKRLQARCHNALDQRVHTKNTFTTNLKAELLMLQPTVHLRTTQQADTSAYTFLHGFRVQTLA